STVVTTVLVFPGRVVVNVRLRVRVTTCAGSVTVAAGTAMTLPFLTTTFWAGTRTSVLWLTVITLPVTWIVWVAAAAEPDPPTTLPSHTPPAKSARMTGRPIRSRCGYARVRPIDVAARIGMPGVGDAASGSGGCAATAAAATVAAAPPLDAAAAPTAGRAAAT